MKKYIIFTDGASRGNPGNAASAYVIKDQDGLIWQQEGIYIGKATNNEAEYRAVILALQCIIRNMAKYLPYQVEIKSDSMLMTKQLSGKFKVKNSRLKELFNQIKELEKQIGTIEYFYVPRINNIIADKLANIALDKISR